eukprot:4929417-Karenia_brevis.AAC.1
MGQPLRTRELFHESPHAAPGAAQILFNIQQQITQRQDFFVQNVSKFGGNREIVNLLQRSEKKG